MKKDLTFLCLNVIFAVFVIMFVLALHIIENVGYEKKAYWLGMSVKASFMYDLVSYFIILFQFIVIFLPLFFCSARKLKKKYAKLLFVYVFLSLLVIISALSLHPIHKAYDLSPDGYLNWFGFSLHISFTYDVVLYLLIGFQLTVIVLTVVLYWSLKDGFDKTRT